MPETITSPNILKLFQKVRKSAEFIYKKTDEHSALFRKCKEAIDEKYGKDKWEDVDMINNTITTRAEVDATFVNLKNPDFKNKIPLPEDVQIIETAKEESIN